MTKEQTFLATFRVYFELSGWPSFPSAQDFIETIVEVFGVTDRDCLDYVILWAIWNSKIKLPVHIDPTPWKPAMLFKEPVYTWIDPARKYQVYNYYGQDKTDPHVKLTRVYE